MEHLQFLFLLSPASILRGLQSGSEAALVHAYSSYSGVGKSTAGHAALSFFGHWAKLMMRGSGGVTEAEMIARIGAFHSLLSMCDEVTNISPREASDLAYAASSGIAKGRSKTTGGMQATTSDWSAITLTTGNTTLSEKLGGHRMDAGGEVMRVLEVICPQVAWPQGVSASNQLLEKLRHHHGHAADVYINLVVSHQAQVKKLMTSTEARLVRELDLRPTERFWTALLVSVVVAHTLCTRLGLISFPLDPLVEWMRRTLADASVRCHCNASQSSARRTAPGGWGAAS
jgi:uncharacterized protein (DUF927 family)